DGLCATASSGRGTTLERSEATPSGPGSLGSFYTLVTLLLGMKPGEHEYKVMGLAPYAPAGPTERATAALRTVFDWRDARPCRFEWKKRGPLYRALLEATLGLRFDGIAGPAPVRPRVPRPRDRRRRGRGGDPPARPRRTAPRERARADRRADRGAARVGRRRGALRWADGVRRAGARQPLDPREPRGPPR